MDVISVDSLSVAYKMYSKPTDILREAIFGGQRHDKFWALRDVSLKIRDGERIGIVGPNGAGKSTLLKVIAGNLTPTSGKISVNGKISSLLSMTPAWNEEANGIENIRFNLLLQGMPDKQIARAVEDIIDFTELGQFIYQPVKTYSTGMGARLSFAIATATEPDILIIDEVLGTGDGYFAAKAYQRMQEFCERGRALLFVSHSVAAVQQMCSTAIWMQHGTVRMMGDAQEVLAKYEFDYRQSEDEATRGKQIQAGMVVTSKPSVTEIGEEAIRLRIVPESGLRFSTNHYVRKIVVENPLANLASELPLALPIDDANAAGRLDLLSSEWGRLHERYGIDCRLLQRASGRSPGGQITLGHELALADEAGMVHLRISVEIASHKKTESLTLEALDLSAGAWKGSRLIRSESLSQGWERLEFEVDVPLLKEEIAFQVREALIKQGRGEVEIAGVEMRASGKPVRSVREYESFDVAVHVLFNKAVPVVDVGLKFSRADGTYVYWQSSGMVDANIVNASGPRTVTFQIQDNVFGAGEYFVNAYVADGWKFPENYPYAQVYHRMVNALAFRIVPAKEGVDCGIVAKLFPVVVDEL